MTHAIIKTSNSLPPTWDVGQMYPIFNRIDTAINSLLDGTVHTETADFDWAHTWTICNGSGTITVSLPDPTKWNGAPLHLKTIAAFTVVSASSNVIPLTGGAAGTAILAATAGKWATLVSNGASWVICEGN